ncbi:conserved hypothetical protein [Ricinus communis]|uniref:NfeD-like C-terminal domain-containing protein n=1 Tax=Ricinus communis TaxID=3988 RepID=B9TH93_RICCO|nr:conserved hypothetical protein [Ricinus communis]
MMLPVILLACAVALVLAELHLATLHAAGMAVGCAIAALITYLAPETSHLILAGIFAVTSTLVYFLLRKVIKPLTPVVMADSIGRTATVASVSREGAVRVAYRDSEWDADVVDAQDSFLKKGDLVRIQGVSGIRLVVKSTV